MVKDRLKEFQENCHVDGTLAQDDHVKVTILPNDNKTLLDLLTKIGPLYKKLENLLIHGKDLRRLLHEPDGRSKLEDKVESYKIEARAIRNCLIEIKRESEESEGVVKHAAKVHHLALAIYLSEALQELSALQAETHERHVQYVKKELIITGRDAMNEEELETLLDQSTEVFTQNIIQDTKVARQQLVDLRDRHDAVLRLEKSITELWQMFQDLAAMVESQGESINKIDNYIFEAENKTEAAKKQLTSAKESQTKARKKKLIIAIIVAAVLLILLLIIIFSFTG